MYIRIDDVTATCPACGHPDFRPPATGRLTSEDRLACAACGVETCYGELLEHMGEEAMRRANEALANLRKGRRRPL